MKHTYISKSALRVISLILLLSIAFIPVLFTGCSKKDEDLTTLPETEPQADPEKINPFTGLKYEKSKVSSRPVFVSINNAPAARPQWGLTSPDMIMEFEVEGGATRMVWVYARAEDVPEKIGSVRSARHYFVEMAEGFDAIFIHWGGSPYAYDRMKELKTDHIDGMSYSTKYFARDESRKVGLEHTGYTTGSNIISAIKDLKVRTEIKDTYKNPFNFAPENSPRELSGQSCSEINAVFSSIVKYNFKYKAADNRYYSYLNQNKTVDDKGQQVAVENVFVLFADVESMNTAKGHVTYDLSVGEGYYAYGGKAERIKWVKGSDRDTLKLYDLNGEELIINPGKSWMGFVKTANEKQSTIVA
ncbi:MAG: DUF3048 domain-containing protein [Clostridiales bacterium]|jgi:hypothetical protein|nr:DUF3048 domain-containing protein [Clostridiales bacterium]HOA34057.1 DUF3048 domain-containing protein [Clostridiales bacterium]HOL79183.1 DUF3048 domain-containing protein [Clostridiales bacterium]HPP68989.1 DUF3048 domain-containing protein [Clostridiales bacterium]HPU67335.1 DUF3048 domain-containing protein [Clostridiales bacterium]